MTSETSSAATIKIAAIATLSTLFLLSFTGLHILKEATAVLGGPVLGGPLRQTHVAIDEDSLTSFVAVEPGATEEEARSYYVFLQKFPLEYTFKSIFHTEVILCPKDKLDQDFTTILDQTLATLEPSRFSEVDESTPSLQAGEKEPFAEIPKDKWSTQSSPNCIQLGYGGSTCKTPCCSVPHKSQNVAYALNSQKAVIGNAMGDSKQLFLYGETELKDGADAAFRAVCHGHYGAIEEGKLPTCVSNWAGTDYNPITNNCNTFTSTLLKCVFGMSDKKPSLWVSDLMSVTCPTEQDGVGQGEVNRCVVPGEELESSLSVE